MTGVTLKITDDWFLDAYQSREARTNWLWLYLTCYSFVLSLGEPKA